MKEKNELLASAKLTSKGQITIPKIVRETLNIEEGTVSNNFVEGFIKFIATHKEYTKFQCNTRISMRNDESCTIHKIHKR